MLIQGRVWKFGDNINTDLMMPAMSRRGRVPEDEAKNYCMYAVRPEFAKEVKKGDIVVAGKNCGCGSSRLASLYFKELKVGCIIAESFNSTFFRNSISIGFPAIEVPRIGEFFSDGDKAEVDLDRYIIKNITRGISIDFQPYPTILKKIFDAGGIIELLKQELEQG